MKRNRIFLVSAMTLMLVSFLFTACLNNDSVLKEDVVKNFLHEFFSINSLDRYEKLMELTIASDSSPKTTGGVSELPMEIQQAYEDYYLPFENYASDSCIAEMKASRLPIKYDALFAEYAAKVEVHKIKIVPVNENSYDFEVLLKADQNLEEIQSPVRGKVTTRDVDGETLVDSISIFN